MDLALFEVRQEISIQKLKLGRVDSNGQPNGHSAEGGVIRNAETHVLQSVTQAVNRLQLCRRHQK